MSMTQSTEATIVLSAAIRNGVVDTVLHPFSSPLITALMRDTKAKRKDHIQNPNTFSPYEHPRSTSFQVNSLPAVTPETKSNYNCAEVARFVVPWGHVGFIEYIEQVLNDVDGNYYPTNMEYWGSPQAVLAEVENIRWWLKVDYFNGALPTQFVYTDPAVFGAEVAPGMPYSDMAEVDSIWYPAHNNKRLKLMIPGGRMLRFYYYSPPLIDFEWKVRGRLTGYTQSIFSTESMVNARRLL